MMMMTGPHGWSFDPGSSRNMSLVGAGYSTFSGSGTLGGYSMSWGGLTASSMTSGDKGGLAGSSDDEDDEDDDGYGGYDEDDTNKRRRMSEIVNTISSLPARDNDPKKKRKKEAPARRGEEEEEAAAGPTPLPPVNPISSEHIERVLSQLREVERRHSGDGKFVESEATLEVTEETTRITIEGDAEYLIDPSSCTLGGEHRQYIALRRRWDAARGRFSAGSASGSAGDRSNSSGEEFVTLKIGNSPCYGEWYIYRVLSERRSKGEAKPFFEEFDRGYFFKNTSVLVVPQSLGGGAPQRTFQGVVQAFQERKATVPEVLAMYLAHELLEAVDRLHRAGVAHLDIQPSTIGISDVCYNDGDRNRNGNGPERGKAVLLLDYIHGVDRRLYPSGQLYEWDLDPTFFDCVEMRVKKPWGFQVDNHGIAISIYCLLMMEWPEFVLDPVPAQGEAAAAAAGTAGRSFVLRFKKALSPEWRTDIWEPLLHTLSNSRDDTDLLECGKGIRTYFENNPGKVIEAQVILNTL